MQQQQASQAAANNNGNGGKASVLHRLYNFLRLHKARDRRNMSWLELIHFIMSYRFALVPLQSIMLIFMFQSISELTTSVYGMHLVAAASDLAPVAAPHDSIKLLFIACLLPPILLTLCALIPIAVRTIYIILIYDLVNF